MFLCLFFLLFGLVPRPPKMEERGCMDEIDELVKSKRRTPKAVLARSLDNTRSLQHTNLELSEEVDKLEVDKLAAEQRRETAEGRTKGVEVPLVWGHGFATEDPL